MTASVLVDVDQLDRDALAEIGTACAQARAELVPLRDVRDTVPASALVVAALRRGERRISPALIDLMARLSPDASVLLLSEEPLIRPAVATHGGRVTLLARPASPARIRGTVRMLLADRGGARGEHLDAQVFTALVEPGAGSLYPPAVRRDAGSALTAVIPLEAGWSGAEDLCDDADLIAQAGIDDDERHRRLHELLGNAAGMLHLAAHCRQWVAYWPTAKSPLLLCSALRLPRVCNVAEAASRTILTLAASPGDMVVAAPRELAIGSSVSDLHLMDGAGAFIEQLEAHGARSMPALIVELR